MEDRHLSQMWDIRFLRLGSAGTDFFREFSDLGPAAVISGHYLPERLVYCFL